MEKKFEEKEVVEVADTTGTEEILPLLYSKREYIVGSRYSGKTTSCQTTSNPTDYGPDD